MIEAVGPPVQPSSPGVPRSFRTLQGTGDGIIPPAVAFTCIVILMVRPLGSAAPSPLQIELYCDRRSFITRAVSTLLRQVSVGGGTLFTDASDPGGSRNGSTEMRS